MCGDSGIGEERFAVPRRSRWAPVLWGSLLEVAEFSHDVCDGSVSVGEGAVEGVELFVLFAGGEVGAVDVCFLVGHGLDGLRDGKVSCDFRTCCKTPEDG